MRREDLSDFEVPAELANDFDWDPVKARANRQNHHMDFWIAVRIWQGDVVERPDTRRAYGEDRIQAFGK